MAACQERWAAPGMSTVQEEVDEGLLQQEPGALARPLGGYLERAEWERLIGESLLVAHD